MLRSAAANLAPSTARLSIMVGGAEEVFNECKDLLLAMGKSAVRVGDVGSGNVTKLANQIMVALHIAAMSEAFVLGAKAGVDPALIFNAIRGGPAGSNVLEAKACEVVDWQLRAGLQNRPAPEGPRQRFGRGPCRWECRCFSPRRSWRFSSASKSTVSDKWTIPPFSSFTKNWPASKSAKQHSVPHRNESPGQIRKRPW